MRIAPANSTHVIGLFTDGVILVGASPLDRLLLVRDYEVDCAYLIAAHGYRFFPRFRLREQWALDAPLGENVEGMFLAQQIPAFMPCHDLIRPRRYVGELETSALVGNGIVGV